MYFSVKRQRCTAFQTNRATSTLALLPPFSLLPVCLQPTSRPVREN